MTLAQRQGGARAPDANDDTAARARQLWHDLYPHELPPHEQAAEVSFRLWQAGPFRLERARTELRILADELSSPAARDEIAALPPDATVGAVCAALDLAAHLQEGTSAHRFMWGVIGAQADDLLWELVKRLDLATDSPVPDLVQRTDWLRWACERAACALDRLERERGTLRGADLRVYLELEGGAHGMSAVRAAARRVADALARVGGEPSDALALAVDDALLVWTVLSGHAPETERLPAAGPECRPGCGWSLGHALSWAHERHADDWLASRLVEAWAAVPGMAERVCHGPLALVEVLRAECSESERRRAVLAWAGLLLLARRESVPDRPPTWAGAEVVTLLARVLRVAERELPAGELHTLVRDAADDRLTAERWREELLAVPPELLRAHAATVAGAREQERALRGEAERSWREVSSARDRLRALALPSVAAMTLPEQREWWAAVEVAARDLGPEDVGEAGTLLRAVEHRDLDGARAALRIAVAGWGEGYDLPGSAAAAPPVAPPVPVAHAPLLAVKLREGRRELKRGRLGHEYAVVLVRGEEDKIPVGWLDALKVERASSKTGMMPDKDKRSRAKRWLSDHKLPTDLDALGDVPGLDA